MPSNSSTSTSTPQFNSKSPTIKRILREASELSTNHNTNTDFRASPLDSNLFEWHFTLRGPPSSPYADGLYHGRIVLPTTYPLRPPSFRFLTPSGRFETNREICLSISGHHEETWQPAWGIRTALVALRSFMAQDAKGQVGGLECEEGARRRLARESRAWRCGACGGRRNEEVFVGEEGVEDGRGEGGGEEVPGELRLGYRDELELELGMGREGEREREREKGQEEERSAPVEGGGRSSTGAMSTSAAVVTARAPPGVVNDTRADTTWIDKAIVALLACLALMVGKKILHL
ncbi:MAG: hypothetical protein M1816_007169 [Peltula sp. TS41687]|nr:MAG: hypothetical protein M1816_007169 [Peltula sp. TS41687]